MLSASLEKYLLCIYERINGDKELKSTEIAREMNQPLQKAVQALQRLHYQKYITYSAYQPLRLTDQGKQVAQYLMARNQLIDEFLNILHIEKNKETEKEAMQQYLSYDSLKTIEKFVIFNKQYPEIMQRYEMILKREPIVYLLPELPSSDKR
ncbi:metal-dependent transcriptional regulator [Cellulosilyticum ruminicola]|uniref:metal-dependent transcriptional regulator n=1 Tax=Cellulosilyticum ruminicola TaxID=425254 RepID=UPI0006D006E2|nr:metal-dependent transcriptional regulator [Cellulosilyticum ruminicola]